MTKNPPISPEAAEPACENPFDIKIGKHTYHVGIRQCDLDFLSFEELCEISEETRQLVERAFKIGININVDNTFYSVARDILEKKRQRIMAMQNRHEQTS